jgi:hypothetical protein
MAAATIIPFLEANPTSPTTPIPRRAIPMVEHLFNPNDISPEEKSVLAATGLQLHAVLYESINHATGARSPRPSVILNELNEAKAS